MKNLTRASHPIAKNPWERTLPACTKVQGTVCTQDACAPRRPLPLDHARIFARDTKITKKPDKTGGRHGKFGILQKYKDPRRCLTTIRTLALSRSINCVLRSRPSSRMIRVVCY